MSQIGKPKRIVNVPLPEEIPDTVTISEPEETPVEAPSTPVETPVEDPEFVPA